MVIFKKTFTFYTLQIFLVPAFFLWLVKFAAKLFECVTINQTMVVPVAPVEKFARILGG